MEEALELERYLPASFGTASELVYMQFLWKAFQDNYADERYEFSSLAFHLLYMSYVSFSVWQIRQAREAEFRNALIGYQAEAENKILNAESPFHFFEKLKESQIFRFLKIIGCDNEQVGEFAKFVRRRNKIAHPSGSVFFNDRESLDREVAQIMVEVRNIQSHMRPVIEDLYQTFLDASADEEERRYADPDDEVREVLVHGYYLSPKDIEICAAHDISRYSSHPHFGSIETLHESLRSSYLEEEQTEPAIATP